MDAACLKKLFHNIARPKAIKHKKLPPKVARYNGETAKRGCQSKRKWVGSGRGTKDSKELSWR